MWEGVGRMEWSEEGGKWDNCNSIINKYIQKKEMEITWRVISREKEQGE